MRAPVRGVVAILTLAWAACAWAEPDEEALGKSRGYPVGTRVTMFSMANRVGAWSAMDAVPDLPIARVPRGPNVTALPAQPSPTQIQYRHNNIGYTLDDYLDRQRITGLLILKDGQVVAERYRYGRTAGARFLSFSMAKSVTSLLVGAALSRGLIASLDDPAEKYAPELAGSDYGRTPLRHLLRMSSGLRFTERYDGRDDVARLARSVATGQPPVTEVLRSIGDRERPSGEKFVYASAETEVLGRVLRGATGRSVADLTRDWLWQPMGAEHDAFWCTDRQGQETTYSCFNASLRDWGRLGLLLARDGKAGDVQVIPRDYLLDATDIARQPPAFAPYRATRWFGYGYQFWLHPLRERSFGMQGVFGQTVFVQPASGIVMVQTAVYADAAGAQDPAPYAERASFWLGVLRSLGGHTESY